MTRQEIYTKTNNRWTNCYDKEDFQELLRELEGWSNKTNKDENRDKDIERAKKRVTSKLQHRQVNRTDVALKSAFIVCE